MNNYDKFMGKLYDILLSSNIISYDYEPKDLKEKHERLEKYLNKLGRVQTKAISREGHIETLKSLYYDKYIIKPENIPEGYFKSLEQKYLDEGYGHHNLVNPGNETDRKLREEHISAIIREQQDSLDIWIDYFFSKDSDYLPLWAKVWAFQGMLGIGNLNNDKDGYSRRSNTAVNPFVSFDSEILGKCVELVKETFHNEKVIDKEIEKLVESGSFQKLYGKLLANKKQLKIFSNDGIWIKYNYEDSETANKKLENGEEPEYLKLYNSLQGYNTGWCTAGSRETAKSQVCGGHSYLGGDFYVYYTKDNNNEYKIPRIAIRMNRNCIGEIRGVAKCQNIEADMENVLEEKLKEFPDGKNYQQKVHNMKMLTLIYNNYQNRELTNEELAFLYEINGKIKGFGYDDDPRIEEIKDKRNQRKDLSIIFNSTEEEIGLTEDDLYKKPLVYYQGNIRDFHYRKLKMMRFPLPKNIGGNLELDDITTAEDLNLPETIGGTLALVNLTTAKGLRLPQTIGGGLYLSSLKTSEGLTLPQVINGDLGLGSLTTAKGLKLPQTIGGDLDLGSLKTAEGLEFPQTIDGYLNLDRLTTVEGLSLPQTIGGCLYLFSLTTAKGLDLSQTIIRDINLNNLTTAEGLKFPQVIGGSLLLCRLKTAKGLNLPQTIECNLILNGLTTTKGLNLPQTIGGSLDLRGLRTAEGLCLPQTIEKNLYLDGLTTAKGLDLSKTIEGDLVLNGLTTAEGLNLPQTIKGNLDLRGLRTAEGLNIPQTIEGTLNLRGLTTAEGLNLPQFFEGTLDLGGLTTAKGLRLPQTISGGLYLSNLTTAEGLNLPQTIGGSLYLSGLTSLKGLKLPQDVQKLIFYKDKFYTFEKFKELVRSANLYQETDNDMVGRNNRRGFTTIIFMGTLLAFITFISIIVAVLLIK